MRCTSIWGHRFVARYSVVPQPLGNLNGPAVALVEIVKVSTTRRYEGDVCVRCGAIAQKVSGREG